MAKFCGKIGFAESKEFSPGVWVDEITERQYYGELRRLQRSSQTTDRLNDDIRITNEISIIADPYANENLNSIRYVEFMGARWKVTSVEVAFPRLNLTTGGVYNGNEN